MKFRSGFVTNSSSTSFCIYGFCISDGDRAFDFAKSIKPDCDNIYDAVYSLAETNKALKELGCYCDANNVNEYYIGVDLKNMLTKNARYSWKHVQEYFDSLYRQAGFKVLGNPDIYYGECIS